MEGLGVGDLLRDGLDRAVNLFLAPLLKLKLSLVRSCKALFDLVDLFLCQLCVFFCHVAHSAHWSFPP